ncbi:S-adenosylmethionine decarboxylase [Desulfurococcus amylolyticus 1221n]|uniref:S-adenosylmethionine decarboxylase proenzyme n=1 Tax=Desulfurococcus amylolyticus (strain DSM 18924 / JCM 16383 / VKM B-2413 / 1221n) TaxID=490899 RepID=B8D361_DESA1|nr:adenosylmethionine decarboxylase [Desulfurococcus amylolyticus]ACL10332.1 S-adenosylmethionine decarboxylase [Desulfurococcus amylolyticus 1221n]
MEALTIKKVIGKHVYGELYECDPGILMNEKDLVEIVKKAAEIGGFTLLDVKAWKINPGVSVVGIVLESHISIHTWPEFAFATVDVYTCGTKGDSVKAYKYIVHALKAKRHTLRVVNRDYEDN